MLIVAASVVDSALIESSYTVNPQQLTQHVPSLYYNSANPRNTAYTIRGLGSNTLSISAANGGIEPGVGFYADQVYHGRPATAAFDFVSGGDRDYMQAKGSVSGPVRRQRRGSIVGAGRTARRVAP